MNSITSIARSGLQTAMLQMNVAAHNIANASTAGFHRQGVALQTQPEGGVSPAALTREALPGNELVEDVVQQMVAMYSFEANVMSLKTGQQVLGTLLDVMA